MNNKAELLLTAVQLAVVRAALELLTKAGNEKEVGRKTLLLAYLLAPDLIGTQRDLAKRIGVTEGRASQMLKVLRRHYRTNLHWI